MSDEETFDNLAGQCEQFLKAKDWRSAREQALKISGQFPNRPQGYTWHFIAEWRLENHSVSNHLADLAIEKFPKNAWVRENRARLAGIEQDWDLASKLWEECIELFPASKSAYAEGARANLNAGRPEKAHELIEKGLLLEPNHGPYISVRADIYTAQNDWARAAQQWAEFRKHHPNNVAAYRKGSEALHRAGEHIAALSVMIDWIDHSKNILPIDYNIATQSVIRGFWDLDLKSGYARKVFEVLILQPITPSSYKDSSAITKNLQTLSQSDPKKYSAITQYIRATFSTELMAKGTAFRLLSVSVGLIETKITDDELIALVSKCNLDVFCRLFSSYPPHKRNVLELKKYLEKQDALSLISRFPLEALTNLHIFATTEELLDTPAFRGMAEIIEAPRPPSRKISPAIISKKLRIAVCVSGQFRGYKPAYESWKSLGLEEHDTHFFVHGWYNTGQKFPTPANSARSFSGEFLAAYKEAAYSYGIGHVQSSFPTLFDSYRTSGVVSEQEIMDFYNTENVVLEDDESGIFANFTSPMKMFYKIYKSWELAHKSNDDFDLLVRIRPDKKILSAQNLSWENIYNTSSRKPVIFADGQLHVNYNINLFLGDQFAVSTPDLMRLYSEIYPNSLDDAGHIRTPSDFDRVHRKLAYTIYDAGLTALKMPDVIFGQPLDPERVEPSRILMLLMQNINTRTPTALDKKFVAALRADVEI